MQKCNVAVIIAVAIRQGFCLHKGVLVPDGVYLTVNCMMASEFSSDDVHQISTFAFLSLFHISINGPRSVNLDGGGECKASTAPKSPSPYLASCSHDRFQNLKLEYERVFISRRNEAVC